MTKLSTGTLTLTRILEAPPARVFQAWTTPEQMMQWWGPQGFTMPYCKIDLRVGGTCHYCMRSPDGQDYWGKSTYREIVEPERIVCADTFADEKGNPVSAAEYGMNANWPAETLIIATFVAHEGKTKLTLVHANIMAEGPERDMCETGWSETLDRLAAYVKI